MRPKRASTSKKKLCVHRAALATIERTGVFTTKVSLRVVTLHSALRKAAFQPDAARPIEELVVDFFAQLAVIQRSRIVNLVERNPMLQLNRQGCQYGKRRRRR